MPHARDVLDACSSKGLEIKGLKSAIRTTSRKKRKMSHGEPPLLLLCSPPEVAPESKGISQLSGGAALLTILLLFVYS